MAYVVSGTRFRALRARGAREAGFFFTDRFLLPRRFQRGIARPWGGSRSVFSTADRDPDPERHYQNIYIDTSLISLIPIKGLMHLLSHNILI